MLRGLGLPQAAPGTGPALDSVKLAALSHHGRTPFSRCDRPRPCAAVIRRIALGKNANYYLKKAFGGLGPKA